MQMFWGDVITYLRQFRRVERVLANEHPDGPMGHMPKPGQEDAWLAAQRANRPKLSEAEKKAIEARLKAQFSKGVGKGVIK